MPSKRKPSSLTQGRAKRALQVGALTTAVGSSYLWQALKRPFQSADTQEQARLELHLKNALRIVEDSRELRGAFMKLVQMLSMRTDILPAEVVNILSVVQSSVPPMDYALIREQVKNELGKYPEQLFKHFEPEAFAAASLGQVHRALLKSGEDVVVKIQYPGVDRTVTQDLKNLRALLQVFTVMTRDVLRQKFDASDAYHEMEERLSEELDYLHEADNIGLFRRLFADDAEIIVPRVYPKFSSRRVLTMEFIDGYTLPDIAAPGVEKTLQNWVVIKYFTITWRQLFAFGVLHTDPHPGNYLVTYHPKLAMLDFGSIRVFPEEVRRQYLVLAKAILAKDEEAMGRCFVALGYLAPNQDPKPLARVMGIMFEGVIKDKEFDPRDFDSMAKTMEIASIGLEHRIFTAPGHHPFLMRALLGLDGYIHQFGVVTNWHRLFRQCLDNAPA